MLGFAPPGGGQDVILTLSLAYDDTARIVYPKYTDQDSDHMAIQVQIAKWGNSLGFRVPHDAARAGLTEGARVDIEIAKRAKWKSSVRLLVNYSRKLTRGLPPC